MASSALPSASIERKASFASNVDPLAEIVQIRLSLILPRTSSRETTLIEKFGKANSLTSRPSGRSSTTADPSMAMLSPTTLKLLRSILPGELVPRSNSSDAGRPTGFFQATLESKSSALVRSPRTWTRAGASVFCVTVISMGIAPWIRWLTSRPSCVRSALSSDAVIFNGGWASGARPECDACGAWRARR